MKGKIDIYKEVTDLFIKSLENGVIPWKKPYFGSDPVNMVSKKTYRGINKILLNMDKFEREEYLTFNQTKNIGGRIRKGEKSTMIVFWKFFKTKNELGKEKIFPMIKYYRVFNIEQTEGIPYPELKKNDINPLEAAENIIKNSKTPKVQFDGTPPKYIPAVDEIHVPLKNQFFSDHELYSTVFHEMVHSTGHKTRLNRDTITGSNLSKEELVAEIGASFLNHLCGFGDKEQKNSESYINGWIQNLKKDKKIIIQASSKAQKAVDYITNTNTNY